MLRTRAGLASSSSSLMLATVTGRMARVFGVEMAAATLLVPASESGRGGMDELHQQTVHLLSFQPLPKEQFDAQAAFNLLAEFGGEAKAGSLGRYLV